MTIRLMATFVLFLLCASARAEDTSLKRIYTCQYDGGADAFTWQYSGEKGVPPLNAVRCAEPDAIGIYCEKVVDANGIQLGGGQFGRGRFCGTDNNETGDYPNTKAFEL